MSIRNHQFNIHLDFADRGKLKLKHLKSHIQNPNTKINVRKNRYNDDSNSDYNVSILAHLYIIFSNMKNHKLLVHELESAFRILVYIMILGSLMHQHGQYYNGMLFCCLLLCCGSYYCKSKWYCKFQHLMLVLNIFE